MATTPEGKATVHARSLLEELGITTDQDTTRDTPRRMAAALAELTAGMALDPTRHLAVTFPPESDDPGLILVTGVPFTSVCEHHMLPFTGTASVAYQPAPGARIVGLSKLARLVQEYGARPQVQERLGQQVLDAITAHLDATGAGCLLVGIHSCMTLRGACATGATMTTTHLSGVLRDDPVARAEFLTLARG